MAVRHDCIIARTNRLHLGQRPLLICIMPAVSPPRIQPGSLSKPHARQRAPRTVLPGRSGDQHGPDLCRPPTRRLFRWHPRHASDELLVFGQVPRRFVVDQGFDHSAVVVHCRRFDLGLGMELGLLCEVLQRVLGVFGDEVAAGYLYHLWQ